MTNALWYFGRGAGVSALVLFTLVMVLGVVVRAGKTLPGLPRFAVTTLHRTTSLTAVAFLVLHVGSLLFDPYAQLRLVDIGRAVPRQLPAALAGPRARSPLDLVVLLVASSLLRQRIGLRAWRAIHWTAYLCWPVAVAHVLGNGTDRSSVWLLAVVAACVLAVVGAVGYRLFGRYDDVPVLRPAALPTHLAGLR